jgi:hypothetical protein
MKYVPKAVTQAVARKIHQAKRNSPHIFFAAGVVGVIGGAVLASRATLKLEETLDEIKEDIDAVKDMSTRASLQDPGYTEHDYHKDLGYVYGKSAVAIVKLYGPSVLVGAVSIAALTGSHIQLTRRNTALTVTLAGISKAFDEYRGRVRKEIGEPREKELYQNIEVVEHKGEQIIRKINDTNDLSQYSVIWDEASIRWTKDPELNRMFLQHQQNYHNDILHTRGFVFLNDVYEALGLPLTTKGQIVGWMIHGDGDNHIDFGLFEARSAAFMNNQERSIILDFNVDGVIYDRI